MVVGFRKRTHNRFWPELDPSWLVVIRVAVLTVVLVAAIFAPLFYGESVSVYTARLFPALGLLFGVSALSGLWLLWRDSSASFAYVQLLIDVVVVTGIVYVTGGPASPFLFLYLPVVMAAAIILSRTSGLIIAAVAGATYSTLVWLLVGGMLPLVDGSRSVVLPTGGILLQTTGLMSAMILIAVATSYLTRKLRSSYLLVEQSRRDLVELGSRQRELIDGIPHGIVTVNLDGGVISVNETAARMLRVEEAEVHNQQFKDVLKQRGFSEELVLENERQHEFEVADPKDPEKSTQLAFHSRPILSHAGEKTGYVLLFHDVTELRSIEEQLQLHERMARLLADTSVNEVRAGAKRREFVGESVIMQKVFQLIDRVAPTDATVLVSGESGTGKELVARAIHSGSGRAEGPFVPVNCGAIPENLIESELFGHRRGSFTGADSDYDGLFRQANGGTIFLDEIGELPMHLQTKLLRTIQERQVRPIGGDAHLPIDVRIVAASNRNLRKAVGENTFREDLFYRLNVINIKLPPLKDRKSDLPLLVQSILKRLVNGSTNTMPMVPPATMQLLMAYDYPGNVRELENILERAFVLGGEVMLPEHLPEQVKNPESAETNASTEETQIIVAENLSFPVDLDDILADLEKRYLEKALIESEGVKKRAAELLGINFRSFRYRLQKFGIGDDA